MAALVSEYMLEFFTLLNARSKKELIEWCMKEELIASSYECPKCNEQMGLNERKSVVLDGFEWRCRKKSDKAPQWSPAVFLDKFSPIVGPGHEHYLLEAVAFPSYPRHAQLERYLADQRSV
ncbi:uncharacterized protein TNCV_3654581 [Trichonephila clavipes]|nr:uncharacterized protein TNCV_3654581 [Trichonephila clavipes]